MQIRCQNCRARLSVPAGDLREVKCPHCGVLMVLPPESASHGDERRSQNALKRMYDPIPRPVVYLAGAGIALLLTSPFWIYILRERFSRRAPIISNDLREIALPSITNSVTAPPLLNEQNAGTLTFDQFRAVRLDAGREDLRRFNLRLQNTRGMVPEIYEAERIGDIEQLTAYFYGNALKEFSIVIRERRDTPSEVQQELVAQFGEPQDVQESDNTARGIGGGLAGLSSGNMDLTQKYPKRRDLFWADELNRVDATIFYDATGTLLSVRVSAAAWLKSNHPLVNASPLGSNTTDRPILQERPLHATP